MNKSFFSYNDEANNNQCSSNYEHNSCYNGKQYECCEYKPYPVCPPGQQGATVAPGTDVSFPQDGPNSGTGIVRVNASSFNLGEIGTYEVLFQVGVSEAWQLLLTLNGADLEYTVVGRATGTSQITGIAIVETTSVNSVLTVRNTAGNAAALTITPLAGGTRPVSAHLVITQIQ